MHFFTIITATLLTITLAADPYCKEGIKSRKVCCPKECGTCGGPKCGIRSKMTKTLCCIGAIEASDYDCNTSFAPCKIADKKPDEEPIPSKPDPWCETGILKRGACCPAGCQHCGGRDCGKRGRMIKSDCCISSIIRKDNSCMRYGPPCVLTEMKMTPEPTEEPLPPMCKEMRTVVTAGCFCYLTLTKSLLVRRRKHVLALCDAFFESRKTIKGFARKCVKYAVGKRAPERRLKLVERINELIPICEPEGTPLIVLKH